VEASPSYTHFIPSLAINSHSQAEKAATLMQQTDRKMLIGAHSIAGANARHVAQNHLPLGERIVSNLIGEGGPVLRGRHH